MKKIFALLLIALLTFALAACGGTKSTTDEPSTTKPSNSTTDSTNKEDPSGTTSEIPQTTETDEQGVIYYDEADTSVTHPDFTKADLNAKWKSSDTQITLNGTTATVKGKGATVSGNVVKITSAGTYVISGTMTNGRIEISVPKTDNVQLVLKGATITCNNYAPIYVVQANKTIITLVKNTVNTISDGSNYQLSGGATKPNAAIFSSDDLTINGTGKLVVNGWYNNGIGTSNDLKIVSGTIEVNATKNALKGNDSVFIIGGNIKVDAGNDAIKSDEETKVGKGFVRIEGGKLVIESGADGIQAFDHVLITKGDIKIKSANDAIKSDEADAGKGYVQIEGGTIEIESAAEGIQAFDKVVIKGGTIKIKSFDDSIKCDDDKMIKGSVEIENGTIDLESTDGNGIQATTLVKVSGGKVTIKSGKAPINCDRKQEIKEGTVTIK